MFEFCQSLCCVPTLLGGFATFWFVENRKEKRQEKERVAKILVHQAVGKTVTEKLIDKEISIGMTEAMVELAWGKKYEIDQSEVTTKGDKKIRWVYGMKRRNARYVWFVNGRVTKFKDTSTLT